MIDWNASAAWIALAFAILTPAVTTFLNNAHQCKMYTLKRKHDRLDQRNAAIASAISGIGLCFSNSTPENIGKFGERFHAAYAYVPRDAWDILNQFYKDVCSGDFDSAIENSSKVVTLLASSYATEDTDSSSFPIWLSCKK